MSPSLTWAGDERQGHLQENLLQPLKYGWTLPIGTLVTCPLPSPVSCLLPLLMLYSGCHLCLKSLPFHFFSFFNYLFISQCRILLQDTDSRRGTWVGSRLNCPMAMWDLSSPTRDPTHGPCITRKIHNQ